MTSQFQILNGYQTITNIALLNILEENTICNYPSNCFSIGIGPRRHILTENLSGTDFPTPKRPGSWYGEKKHFLKTFT